MKIKNRNRLGKWVGSGLLVVALLGVLFYRVRPIEQTEDDLIRPLKSMVVGTYTNRPILHFPGSVEADREVDLAFEVGGRMVSFPVRRGMMVKEGEILGALDPTNFENQLRNVEAELDLARSTLTRMEQALAVNAVSQEEFARASAAVQKAEAQRVIHEKALADTVLRARFDGRVSETFVNRYDNVNPGRPVLKLQDTRQLALAVSVPETYVQWAQPDFLATAPFVVTFDSLPEVEYPATVKEYATVADPVTRTFRVRLQFEHDHDFMLLPGMTGSVRIDGPALAYTDAPPLVPSDAVGFTSDGRAFVWTLEATDAPDVFAAHRHFVQLGRRSGEAIEAEGIANGARIATAGVAMLTEGRRVRLLGETGATAR